MCKCRKLTPNEYRKLQTISAWVKMNFADSYIYSMRTILMRNISIVRVLCYMEKDNMLKFLFAKKMLDIMRKEVTLYGGKREST